MFDNILHKKLNELILTVPLYITNKTFNYRYQPCEHAVIRKTFIDNKRIIKTQKKNKKLQACKVCNQKLICVQQKQIICTKCNNHDEYSFLCCKHIDNLESKNIKLCFVCKEHVCLKKIKKDNVYIGNLTCKCCKKFLSRTYYTKR